MNITDLFYGKCNTAISDISYGISKGLCSDYSSYMKECGKIDGLYAAMDLMQETIKELNEEDGGE
jgi:hypothetical protein